MEIISREILRLDRVVKTFLDFTRPVELNLTEVPLDEFVRRDRGPGAAAGRCLGHPRAASSRRREGVEVRVDRDLLKQAVLNVVVNAIEAMPDGGELRFESAGSDDTAEIRISDTGPGIPPELREKIFRLYFTTKKEGSGHRPGDDVPDRAIPRWYNRFHQRTRQRHHLRHTPADCGVG